MSEFTSLLPVSGIARLLCDAVWQSTLAGCLAWVAVRWLARRPAQRAWLASLALAVCVLAPWISACARLGEVGLLRIPHPPAEVLAQPRGSEQGEGFAPESAPPANSAPATLSATPLGLPGLSMEEGVASTAQAEGGLVQRPWATNLTTNSSGLWTALAVCWGVAALVLGVRLLRGFLALRSLLSQAEECTDPTVLSACGRAARQLGLRQLPAIRVCPRVGCPKVVAWSKPCVLIPPPDTEQVDPHWYAVLCHELAHVRRGDSWARLLVELAAVALPWQPFVWLLRREHLTACEEACDDWAVYAGSDPLDVAEALVRWISPRSTVLALPMSDGPASSRRRIQRLLDVTEAPEPQVGRGWFIGGAGAALLCAVGAAVCQDSSTPKSLPNNTLPPTNPDPLPGGEGSASPSPRVAVLGEPRMMHWNRARVLGFGPQGQTVLSAGSDGRIIVWEVNTGKAQRELVHPAGGLALGAEGRTLFLGWPTGKVQMLEVATGKVGRQWHGPGRPKGALVVSRDGTTLAAKNGAGRVVTEIDVWQVATGRKVQTIPGKGRRLNCLALSPDGRTLAVGHLGQVSLWDVPSGRQRHLIAAHLDARARSFVNSVCFSPDGQSLASAAVDGQTKLWDVTTGKELVCLKDKERRTAVYSVVFNPQGDRLATATGRGVTLWDRATGRALWTAEPGARSLAFRADGKRLVCGTGNRVALLDVTTGRWLGPLADPLVAVAVNPARGQLVTGSAGGVLTSWALPGRKKQHSWQAHPTPVGHLAFSPDGKALASSSSDRTIALWDPATGRLRRRITDSPRPASFLAFSPDGSLLAVPGPRSDLTFWNVADGKRHKTIRCPECRLSRDHFAIGPHGRTLFARHRRNTLVEWDLARAVVNKTLGEPNPSGGRWVLAVSRDGCFVAVGARASRLTIRDLRKGKAVTVSRPHTPSNQLQSLAFSPDGKTLASSAEDGKVSLWNARTGALQETFPLGPLGGTIRQAAFSADGRQLVTANGNGTVSVLSLKPR